MGFEFTTPMFEWAKAVKALNRAATAIGTRRNYNLKSYRTNE
jgi:hypothetical protein